MNPVRKEGFIMEEKGYVDGYSYDLDSSFFVTLNDEEDEDDDDE